MPEFGSAGEPESFEDRREPWPATAVGGFCRRRGRDDIGSARDGVGRRPAASYPATARRPPRAHDVAGAVWMPGLGSALSSIGFGAIIAFSSLLSVERGWSPIWLTFSAFAASLVTARLMLGHLPDRLGGATVALVCAC